MNGSPAFQLGAGAEMGPGSRRPGLLPGAVVQVFLFHADRYLGWDCFARGLVRVGGESEDDLVLDGLRGSGTRLVLYVDGKRVVAHDPSGHGAVRVNDEPFTTRALGPLDVVTVGDYSLKARLEEVESGAPAPRTSEALSTVPAHDPVGTDAGCEGPALTDPTSVVVVPTGPIPGGPVVEGTMEPRPVQGLGARQHRHEAQESGIEPDPDPLGPGSPTGFADPHALDIFDDLLEQATAPADDTPGIPNGTTPHLAGAGTPPATTVTPRASTPPATTSPEASATPPGASEPTAETKGDEPPSAPPPRASWAMPTPTFVPDDEPDEDDDDPEAPFSLLDLALGNPAPDDREELDGVLLQVAHLRGGDLADLALLDHDQRYRHPSNARRARPLAWRDKTGRSYLTLDSSRFTGELRLADGRQVPLVELLTPETRVPRRKGLHRVALPQGAHAHLAAGGDRWVVHEVPRRRSPEVEVLQPRKSGFARNLASSSLVHVVLLMVGSLFVSLPSPQEPPIPETRFVQLDPAQLVAPAAKPAPRPKPKPKPKPKPAATPVKVAKVTKVKPSRTAKPNKAAKKSPKHADTGGNPALASNRGKGPTSAAASPDAGGGHGGNARNRNLEKAGILGALGIPNGLNLGASQAMAAVTNIDAVRSPRSSEAALKVGGIVGSLGSDRVEMPAVGLVNTRGSTQVAVSAGIEGSGTVAALERGRTGETQVRAMVTADIKVPASVTGGMSREEVKRVIDAHMDQISYCYETALIEDDGLMGRMSFEWKILMSGRVGEVRIQSSSIQSDPLHACIKRAIRSWQFPQPRGAEVLVSYPFVFDVVGF